MNNQNFIQSIAEGNATAIAKLYKFFPKVKQYVIKNSGTLQDAEDLFQAALLVIYEKCRDGRLELTSSWEAYLFAICKNMWLNQLRNEKTFTTKENEEGFNEELFRKVEKGTKQLGDKCREILSLFYYHKRSFKDIANELGFVNEKSAKQAKYKCINQLRKLVISYEN